MNKAQKEYPKGNEELLTMLGKVPFDSARALEIIKGIENIDEIALDLQGFRTTYLVEAVNFCNVEAVRFLLDNGADPNFFDEEAYISPFYGLMYEPWYGLENRDPDELISSALAIVKLFLEHGANPNLKYPGEYETLYEEADSMTYFNYDFGVEYLRLLASYGGKIRKYTDSSL